MESSKDMTPIRRVMQLRGVSIRELAGLSGESTALICYITQGLAHFPTYEQLERCAKYMGCAPSDLYTKAELRMFYPEQFPRRKREKDGNPRVRVDRELFAWWTEKGMSSADLSEAINGLIRETREKFVTVMVDIFGAEQ